MQRVYSLIIVMFSLLMVLDSTSLKLSVVWSISTCKEWSTGKIKVFVFFNCEILEYAQYGYLHSSVEHRTATRAVFI